MICRTCKQHLGKSVPSKAGLVLRVTLLDDLAAPRGHSSVQQALTDDLLVCACQVRDQVHSVESPDLNALTITFKLNITLKRKPLQLINPRCYLYNSVT